MTKDTMSLFDAIHSQPRHAPHSCPCSRRPPQSLSRGTVHLCNTTTMLSTTLQHLRHREHPWRHRWYLRARLAYILAKLWYDLLTEQAERGLRLLARG